MKKYLLYGHGGAYNHGAEAIIRSTAPLLRGKNVKILLSAHFPKQDKEFGLDALVDATIEADLSLVKEEKSAKGFDEKKKIAKKIYREALSLIDDNTTCIAVGGDNYCYPNWYRQSIFHETAKERGAKSILWGCSIQPEAIDEYMKTVLSGHSYIYTRESVTYEALKNIGITNISLCPDPAFFMHPQETELPKGFVRNSTAAINLSPMMMRKNNNILKYFSDTARMLLSRFDSVLLLPHVTMPVDDDNEALAALARTLKESEQSRLVYAPSSLNAAQRKYLISQCELLVCCRTHASIAGYSTAVPTLVAGYSVKSEGIGKDLGMENYVVPAEKLSQIKAVTEKLCDNRYDIRQTLRENLSAYLSGSKPEL